MKDNIKIGNNLNKNQAREVNALNLAFIGDAVWTLMVREFFLDYTNFKNNNLHKLTTKFVKAIYQAKAFDSIYELLDEEEKDIARRARNSKMNTVSKNAPLADYKKATSFEAVIGYLYLMGNYDRIDNFFTVLSKEFL